MSPKPGCCLWCHEKTSRKQKYKVLRDYSFFKKGKKTSPLCRECANELMNRSVLKEVL